MLICFQQAPRAFSSGHFRDKDTSVARQVKDGLGRNVHSIRRFRA